MNAGRELRERQTLTTREFRERRHTLARDSKISLATAYRYLHEAIDVIAANAPDQT